MFCIIIYVFLNDLSIIIDMVKIIWIWKWCYIVWCCVLKMIFKIWIRKIIIKQWIYIDKIGVLCQMNIDIDGIWLLVKGFDWNYCLWWWFVEVCFEGSWFLKSAINMIFEINRWFVWFSYGVNYKQVLILME